jgi:Domain of unknown function (DUF6484)
MAKAGEAAPTTAQVLSRLDGVVIGVLMGFDDNSAPLVVFPGNPVEHAVPARTTASLEHDHIGAEVALMFEQGDPARPLIMGRILHPEVAFNPAGNRRFQATIDDQRVELKAEQEIVLRCGKASITLTRAGKILLRGAYLFSRSTGVNKIKGGSIQLN